MNKRNKSLIALLLVLCIGLVGLTIAYFSNSDTIENEFKTKEYGTTYTEEFVSPDNWLPGDKTDKSLKVTNSGHVDEAVRISYSESWTSKTAKNNNQEGDLPLVQSGNKVAIIHFINTDDWTTVTEDGTTYIYYNYKLAPTETTSELLDYVTFNSAITNSSNCTTTESNGTNTIACNSTGTGYDDATYRLVFTIETFQYNKYNEAWNTDVAIAAEKPASGVDILLTSAVNADGTEYNNQTKSKMFKMSHPATEQTPAQTEYRYIGDNPDNYVYFNCDSLDNQNSDTCEVWRIIGVFDDDDGTGNYEQRIKLVRGSALPDTKQWDNRTSEQYPNDNYGKNEWVGSTMQTYLNDDGDYYQRTGIAVNYGLKATAKNMISDAKYYLGGTLYGNNGYGTADAMYLWERGTSVLNYDNYCFPQYSTIDSNWNTRCTTENYCENNPTDEICNVIRSTSWVGVVALMYPSDHYLVYANGVDAKCYGDPDKCTIGETSSYGTPNLGWIYNSNKLVGQNDINIYWLLSPFTSFSSYGF